MSGPFEPISEDDRNRPPPASPPPVEDPEQTQVYLHLATPLDPSAWCESSNTHTFISPTDDEPEADEKATRFLEPSATLDSAANLSFTVQPPPRPRYRVGAEIGRGGVGLVHEGWDFQLERQVSFKSLLPAHQGNNRIVQRFIGEAQITARLHHPGVVPIHELTVLPDGRPCFVMELVRGETLQKILAIRTKPTDDQGSLLSVFEKVCQVIAYAHSQDVIHRDLKPANIMVGEFGVVKVMDWGLGKCLSVRERPADLLAPSSTTDPRLDETQMGTIFGTLAYLSPEQARGDIERVDKRADVFGLGAILCEILTGLPPYVGPSAGKLLSRARNGRIADAMRRLNNTEAPLDLILLAQRCLESEPERRPESAVEVAEGVTNYLRSDQRRAERDLVRFFDLSLDLFCIANANGYFRRVNDNFTRVLGYTAEELTTRPFVEFVHPDDRDSTRAEVARLSQGEPTIQFLNRYRTAGGEYVVLEWSAQGVPEERAIYAAARDVSDRLRLADAHRAVERSHEHLAQIVDSAEVAIISTDLKGIIQSWNLAAEHLFGYTAGEMVGQSVEGLIPEGDESAVQSLRDRLSGCQKIEHYEATRRRKNGTLVPVYITISPIRDEAGRIVGASKIARDISLRKQSEAALRESEARLRALIESAADAVIMIEPDGTIDLLNRSAERMFGYEPGTLLGRNVRELMPQGYRQRHDLALARYVGGGTPTILGQTVSLEGLRRDGSVFPLELVVNEVRVGERRLFSGILRDVSRRMDHAHE